MKTFNGYNKERDYFEGWYFKHSNKNNVIVFIPGINIDEFGKKSAFIQVVSDKKSYNFIFDYEDFYYSSKKFFIKIGENIFSQKGVILNIDNGDVKIKAKIRYSEFTRLNYNLMGPFSKIPLLECYYEVISANHIINGKIKIDNIVYSFENESGYIEKNWGRSFPKKYTWTQYNSMKGEPVSILASIADVSIMGKNFRGCVAFILYKGKEYRLATYNFAKILKCSPKSIVLTASDNLLIIEIKESEKRSLLAPQNGDMTRVISEQPCCEVRYILYNKGELIIDITGQTAGFEFID